MNWMKQIPYEDLLEDDLELIYEYCGEDVLLALLDKLKGQHLFLKAAPVSEAKKRYIRRNAGHLSVKEMMARLDVSSEFVYQVLRDDPETDDDPHPDLFTQLDENQ